MAPPPSASSVSGAAGARSAGERLCGCGEDEGEDCLGGAGDAEAVEGGASVAVGCVRDSVEIS